MHWCRFCVPRKLDAVQDLRDVRRGDRQEHASESQELGPHQQSEQDRDRRNTDGVAHDLGRDHEALQSLNQRVNAEHPEDL